MTYQQPLEVTRAAPPRARGKVSLSVKRRGAATVLEDFHQAGSLKLLFPRHDGGGLQGAIVNTAGGITGGDRFAFSALATPGTSLTLTTQAAERAYRAQPSEVGRLDNRLHVSDGARLDWLPQETLLYEGAALHRRTEIALEGDAQILFCEPLIFGRAAMGEVVRRLRWSDHLSLTHDGALRYLDPSGFDGDITAHMAGNATGGGATAMATLLYRHRAAETQLDPLREMVGPTGGVSCLAPDLLVLRLLAPDGFDLRQRLCPILMRLSGRALPKPWMI